MSDNKDSNEQEYKGLSKTASVFGQGDVDALKGLAVGGAIGAAIGAVSHSDEVQKEAATKLKVSYDLLKRLNKLDDKEALKSLKAELFKDVKSSDILKSWWEALGRGSKALIGAAIIGTAVAAVTQIVGYFRGYKKAKAARAQFDEITAENRGLKEKLSVIEAVTAAQAKPEKSFVADLDEQRAKQAVQSPSL